MKNNEEIGVGIIGLGMGRQVFIAHQLSDSTMRVRAICDSNADLLQSMAVKHDVPFTTTDYRELVRRPDVDVVAVYSPDPLHFEHIMAALDAGKHVICTKPMVTNLRDARLVQDAVRRSGRKFLVGQTCRFIPAFMAASRLMREGRYGRPLYIEAVYNHDLRSVYDETPWRWQMPQDLLFGGLCHPMDLALWLGGPLEEVSAFASCSQIDPRFPADMPDNYIANLHFQSGAIGRVMGLYGCPHPEGLPHIELTVSGTTAASHGNKITWETEPGQRTVETISNHLPVAHEGVEYDGHKGEVASYLLHMEHCIRHDTQPEPGITDGVRIIAALEAVRQSTQTGRSVKVENCDGE